MLDDSAEQFRLKAVEWAKADGEARRLEKMEKIVFSEIVNQQDSAIGKAEHSARSTEAYKKIVWESVAARTAANVLKAETEAMQMSFEIWRTKQSTKRAEMGMR